MTSDIQDGPQLPDAVPQPEAVAAGVFGVLNTGPVCPDADDVAAIIREHAVWTLQVLLELTEVQRRVSRGLDCRTGRRPKDASAAQLSEETSQRELARLRTLYAACISSCETGFGAETAERFDAWIRAQISADDLDAQATSGTAALRVQKELF